MAGLAPSVPSPGRGLAVGLREDGLGHADGPGHRPDVVDPQDVGAPAAMDRTAAAIVPSSLSPAGRLRIVPDEGFPREADAERAAEIRGSTSWR